MWQRPFVDVRLFSVGANRPGKVRQQDIPNLARAIIFAVQGLATVDPNTTKNVSFVRIWNKYLDVLVLAEDWARLLPDLQVGTFDNVIQKKLNPEAQDFGDPIYYERVLATLYTLFKDAEAYPKV